MQYAPYKKNISYCTDNKSCAVLDVSKNRAFTLMEVMLAIALIAVLGTFISMSAGLFSEKSLKSRPPHRVFLSSLRFAQNQAISTGKSVELLFNNAGYIIIQDHFDKTQIAQIWLSDRLKTATDKSAEIKDSLLPDNDIRISFMPKAPEILANESVSYSRYAINNITFSADGTCTPVTVIITEGDNVLNTMDIDPFNASPIRKGVDEK